MNSQNLTSMEANKSRRKIVMLPWLAFGHISPHVELAKKLSQKNFQIFICSSRVNLESIQSKLPQNCSSSNNNNNNNSIQLIELNLPSLPELPPHMHTSKGLPHHLIPTLYKAFLMAAPHFHSILQQINPHLLITELIQPWACQSATSLNIPVVYFLVVGAGTFTPTLHKLANSDAEFPFPELDLRHHWISRTPENIPKDSSQGDDFNVFLQWWESLKVCSDVVLVNSFREIEGKYIDYLSVSLKKKVIPVGPLIQEVEEKSDWILEWLDKKKPKSTVYVSFGSEYYLSKRDMEELGMGLEMSGANFIWVVRFPKGGEMKIEEALPDGFIERVGDKGIVVDGWAPQLKILKHSSVGGFVCHCGWNSVVEAIVNGMPIIALPMRLDQPSHAVVAVSAGVAVEAARGADGSIQRQGVANAIRQVLFEKIGENVHRKAKQNCEILKIEQGKNIDGCVAELNKLCESSRLV